ncbi:hypothetical protein CSKR_202712 [Clonorchis sinensis]|nr:hypothetical protein CSKR_202712 [Clonorchis sinensis]
MQPGVSLDWPMRLLLSCPGRYELPRGISSVDGERISWFAVPIRYRFPAYQALPPLSLFDLRVDWLGSQNKCELVAIVTDDMEVFGPAWANILQLANGAPLSSDELGSHVVKPIPIVSTDEAPQKLRHLLYPVRSRPTPQRSVNKGSLVLIDVADLSSECIAELDVLPCQLVTCDYFIQSLICGHLLNPADSSAFVPPRH